jgi:hypothetical protein
MSVESVQVLFLDQHRDEHVPNRQKYENDNGEDHLDVGLRRETKDAKHEKLADLAGSAGVDLLLEHLPYVVLYCILFKDTT